MNTLLRIFLLSSLAIYANGSDEILNILNSAKDLTLQEANSLGPLFEELQKQYDYIREATEKENKLNLAPWQKEIWPEYNSEDYYDLFESLIVMPTSSNISNVVYEDKLPTIEELIGDIDTHNHELNNQQLLELEDLKQLLQETLEEAQSNVNEIIRRSVSIESELLKLNKPYLVEIILGGLSSVFQYSVKFRRAAYCIYSHVPYLNESLQNINNGIDCYKYVTQLIRQVQSKTVSTVTAIRGNILNLAKIYKKIAAKKTIFGKIVTAILNFTKISRNTLQTYVTAAKAFDDLQNKLPKGVSDSMQCGKDFARTLPQMKATVVNITSCITFVDNTSIQYEFLLPESERNNELSDLK